MKPGIRMLIGLLAFGCALLTCIALLKHGLYGWTSFIALPLFAGGVASWSFRPRSTIQALQTGIVTGLIGSLAFLVLGIEGIFCVLLSLPLILPLSMLGSWIVYRATGLDHSRPVALALLLPATFLFDVNAKPPVYSVRTSIVVNAPPETVWKYAVAFPDIAAPREWVFRAGIAYPQRTRMEGSGVGAARYCDLSTGPIVERVTAWEEPRLLRFTVTSTAPSMRETGLYGDVHPKHLNGFFVSKQGQFTLTRQPFGQTLLEGTSWYQHGLWPAEYWRWWTDAIVHRIHLRVLRHIRTLSESDKDLLRLSGSAY